MKRLLHSTRLLPGVAAFACVIAALLCTSIADAAAVRVHRPIFEPALMHTGVSTTVRLTTFINHGGARAVTAQVYALDAAGRPGTVLAALHDDGRDGDLYAEDQRFSATLQLNEHAPVVQRYAVSAQIEGQHDPLWSTTISLETLPREVPLGSAPPAFRTTLVDPKSEASIACDGVMVYFAKGADYAQVEAAAARAGARVRGVTAMHDGNAWNFELPCTDLTGVTEALRTLEREPFVEGAEPQALADLHSVSFDDEEIAIQTPGSIGRWVDLLGHTRAWNLTKGQRNFDPMVAIIDTGVDYNHEDLIDRVTLGKDFVGVNDFDPMDEQGHGTGKATLVGALTNNRIGIAGGAPDSRLLAIRVGNLLSTIDHVCDGVDYAVANGASILNMSLGTTLRSRRLAASIDAAVDAGLLVIAAAGNRLKERKEYPAAFSDTEYFGAYDRIVYHPQVIGVGAIDTDGTLAEFPHPVLKGSNYGFWIDVSAYGIAIEAVPGTELYASGNGTSVSAPMVSAAAALVWSMDATLSGSDVRSHLLASAQPTGFDDPAGNALKRLNTFTAVLRAGAQACAQCLSTPLSSIVSAPFPSPGARINLGFSGNNPPIFGPNDTQTRSIHGVALPLLPRVNPFPVPTTKSTYAVTFSSNLRSFDAYNSQNGLFDLFAISLGFPYFNQSLTDDVRPSINDYLAVGGDTRITTGPALQIGNSTAQTVELSTTVLIPSLSIVLDTQTLPNRDSLKPSWGTITLQDITPPNFE